MTTFDQSGDHVDDFNSASVGDVLPIYTGAATCGVAPRLNEYWVCTRPAAHSHTRHVAQATRSDDPDRYEVGQVIVTWENVPADPPFTPLLGQILSKLSADAAHTTNAIIDVTEQQRDEAVAVLAAVRLAVGELLDGPYAPNTREIERAVFYPSRKLVEEIRTQMKEETR